jgi:hypothetical protein
VRGKAIGNNYTGIEFSWHSGAHLMLGAFNNTGNVSRSGDLADVVTSPNEPLFMFHHANLDRSKMWYMFHNANKKHQCFGFPVRNATAIPAISLQYPGINLNDAAASAWGFTGAMLGLNSNNVILLTHADSLCLLSPWASPYIYDDMVGVTLQKKSLHHNVR